MKKFRECLKNHTRKIINFKRKEMKLLAKGQQESYENAKICYIRKENFEDKYAKDNKSCKVRHHCHYIREYESDTHSVCNLKFSVPKDVNIIFDYVSNCHYHFIIKELAEEFEGQFTYIR